MSKCIAIHPVTADGGWIECQSCAFNSTETCDFCDEADQYEEADMEDSFQKLLAA